MLNIILLLLSFSICLASDREDDSAKSDMAASDSPEIGDGKLEDDKFILNIIKDLKESGAGYFADYINLRNARRFSGENGRRYSSTKKGIYKYIRNDLRRDYQNNQYYDRYDKKYTEALSKKYVEKGQQFVNSSFAVDKISYFSEAKPIIESSGEVSENLHSKLLKIKVNELELGANVSEIDIYPSVYQYTKHDFCESNGNHDFCKERPSSNVNLELLSKHGTFSALEKAKHDFVDKHLLFKITQKSIRNLCALIKEKSIKEDKLNVALLKKILLSLNLLNKKCQKIDTAEDYGRLCMFYELIHDLIFIFTAKNKPYTIQDYQNLVRNFYSETLFLKSKNLYGQNADDIEIESFPSTSGMDAVARGIMACDPEALEIEENAYFEIGGLSVSSTSKVKEKDSVEKKLKIAGNSSHFYDKPLDFLKGKEKPDVVLIDTTLLPGTIPMVESPRNDLEKFIREKMNETKKVGFVVILAKSMQKFALLGTAKAKFGDVTIIGRGDKFNKVKQKLEQYHKKSFPYQKDEFQGIMSILNVSLSREGSFAPFYGSYEDKYIKEASRAAVNFCKRETGEVHGPFISSNCKKNYPFLQKTITFGFPFSTCDGERISAGLEPKSVIQDLKDNYEKRSMESQKRKKEKIRKRNQLSEVLSSSDEE